MQSSRPAGRIGNQKSVGLGIYPIYTGYILPLNRDKTHWVIPQISIHATDTYRDIPCTNNPVWVIPCLSQVHSDGPKDIPGITFWCDYTLYIPGINPDKPSYPTGIRFQMREGGSWVWNLSPQAVAEGLRLNLVTDCHEVIIRFVMKYRTDFLSIFGACAKETCTHW